MSRGFRAKAPFTLLIALLAVGLMVVPLLAFGSALRLVFVVVVIGAMGFVALRLTRRPWLRGAILTFGALSVGMDALAHFAPGAHAVVAGHTADVAFLTLVAATIVISVWREREVDADLIAGGIAGYLLLGLVWSSAFQLVEYLAPGSFAVVGVEGGRWGPWEVGSGVYPRLLFFSFVTLTTLGYGDVVPAGPVAAGIAATEAVVGPLYLAVLIARLVGLHASRGSRDPGGSDPRG